MKLIRPIYLRHFKAETGDRVYIDREDTSKIQPSQLLQKQEK